jgi:hypothetical protein
MFHLGVVAYIGLYALGLIYAINLCENPRNPCKFGHKHFTK